MRIPSDILYNPNGDLRVRLRPVSDQARWRVNRKNTANGIAFARQIVASFQQNDIKAWRHPIGRRYPVTVSVDLGGHSSLSTTSVYLRTGLEHRRRSYANFG